MKIYLNAWQWVVISLMRDISAQVRTDSYLGPESSKPFHFPWLVSFHLVDDSKGQREFFGSGSILTPKWVLASMDSFIARSRQGDQDPFYLDIGKILVIAGGIQAVSFSPDFTQPPSWLQIRQIYKLHMFSNPEKKSQVSFTEFSTPPELNSFKKSIFGFNMAIALAELKRLIVSPDGFEWKSSILPIPLNYGNGESDGVRSTLRRAFEVLEQQPSGLRCQVGGWRVGDWSLVKHEVAYVRFEQCEISYCSYDSRACLEWGWPIKGIHVCFKSLTFIDVCWRDQGSALYCGQFFDSVVAILTTAPTCGHNGLPGVYTLINHGLQLLEALVSRSNWYKPIPKQELVSLYGPPKEKDLYPAF